MANLRAVATLATAFGRKGGKARASPLVLPNVERSQRKQPTPAGNAPQSNHFSLDSPYCRVYPRTTMERGVGMRRRESTSDFVYVGPLNPSSEAKPQKALSPESARYVALSCWRIPGRLRPTGHFTKRLIQRRFDIFDFEEVIRLGKPMGEGDFLPKV